MEIVSEEEWDVGREGIGNEEKRKKIMKIMEGRKGYSMKELSKRSNIKWVYSEIIKMCEENIIEKRKFGKKYMYRKVK